VIELKYCKYQGNYYILKDNQLVNFYDNDYIIKNFNQDEIIIMDFEIFLLSLDVPLYAENFYILIKKYGEKYKLKFSLSKIIKFLKDYEVSIDIKRINNKFYILAKDNQENIETFYITKDLDKYLIFDFGYKVIIETFNFYKTKDILNKLSGYNFNIIFEEHENFGNSIKYIFEITNLSKDELEEILVDFKKEMFFDIYYNNNLILKIDNE
jgi:hypothetical protein